MMTEMTIQCLQIRSDLTLTPCGYEEAVVLVRDERAKVWIDVQGGDNVRLETLLDKLGIRDLTRRLCIEARERPGFYPLNAFVFMVIPIKGDGDSLHEVEYVVVVSNKNLLLTVRDVRKSRVQELTTIGDSASWLHNDTVEGLLTTILMVLSLDTLQQLADLREDIVLLEKRMDREPDGVEMKDISVKRSRLLTLEAVVSGQIPAFQALMATDKPFFELENAREHLASALANLAAADRSLEWLEGRLDVVRSDFEMRAQDKMNGRLGRLTILSLIFMPMTFLAGIWGMNFEYMPELSNPYGYLMALGSMFTMGVAMYFYFRRKRWFD